MEREPLITNWPKIRFDLIEKIDIDSRSLKLFYRSFFVVFSVPGFLVRSFFVALKETLVK